MRHHVEAELPAVREAADVVFEHRYPKS
jgi:hypothetical protein